jgi:alanyl-tRNA synthetase
MSTERLYYRNPSLTTFDGVIVSSAQMDGAWRTILDRTAFYPTSGGQLFDTGKINGVAIRDVLETENGDITHVSNHPVGNVGDKAMGEIDEFRRRMHRQQHTAQHILSYAFGKLFSLETVSVHLGIWSGRVGNNGVVQ